MWDMGEGKRGDVKKGMWQKADAGRKRRAKRSEERSGGRGNSDREVNIRAGGVERVTGTRTITIPDGTKANSAG